MTMVAEKCPYVIGIDTHARTHTHAIIKTRTGARESRQAFPVTAAGMNRAIAWIGRNTAGPVLAAVEGTRFYGTMIASALTGQNTEVVEVKPPRKQARAGVGKNDEIDATAAAMSVLGRIHHRSQIFSAELPAGVTEPSQHLECVVPVLRSTEFAQVHRFGFLRCIQPS